MLEKPQPDPVPADEPPPHPAGPLQIDTPVIDMPRLELKPGFDTRMPYKTLKVMPSAKEDEDALLALERIEKSFKGQRPHGNTQ